MEMGSYRKRDNPDNSHATLTPKALPLCQTHSLAVSFGCAVEAFLIHHINSKRWAFELFLIESFIIM